MIRYLLALFSATCSLYGISLSENLSRSTSYTNLFEEKNIGHITFKLGLSSTTSSDLLYFPGFGIGYQTKVRELPVMQSILIEVEKGYYEIKEDSSELFFQEKRYFYFLPKVYGISYLSSHRSARPFLGIGVALYHVSSKAKAVVSEKEETDFSSLTALSSAFSLGFEFGKQTEAVNSIVVECNVPLYFLSTDDRLDSPYYSLSYVVGF